MMIYDRITCISPWSLQASIPLIWLISFVRQGSGKQLQQLTVLQPQCLAVPIRMKTYTIHTYYSSV